MKTCLPKKTNENTIPRDILFKGVGPYNDESDFEKRKKIILQNNHEYTIQRYEKMGIKILEDNKYLHDLFYNVELPDGWATAKSDHYWNYVLDNKGRKRISYFSKLAVYDRDAFSNFYTRYSFTVAPFDDYKTSTYEDRKFKPWTLYITDGGERVKILKQITPNTDKEYYEVDDVLGKEAIEYLDKNYPEWEDINAYWD